MRLRLDIYVTVRDKEYHSLADNRGEVGLSSSLLDDKVMDDLAYMARTVIATALSEATLPEENEQKEPTNDTP